MTSYMKQSVSYGTGSQHQRAFSLLFVFRSITKGRNHSSLSEKEVGALSMELPYEVEEKIRLFRQKHFRD